MFSLWKFIGILKSKFCDEHLWRSARVHTDVWNQSRIVVELKWAVNNLTGPHISGYKFLNKGLQPESWRFLTFTIRSRIFLKTFDIIRIQLYFFYHTIAIQPTAGCRVDRVKTTRFCTSSVHEYNFNTHCITKRHGGNIKSEEELTYDYCDQILYQHCV